MTTKMLSFRTSAPTVDFLDQQAQNLGRDRTFVINQALEQYQRRQEQILAEIKTSLCQAQNEEFAPDSEVEFLLKMKF